MRGLAFIKAITSKYPDDGGIFPVRKMKKADRCARDCVDGVLPFGYKWPRT
jgi:hypothetical protein